MDNARGCGGWSSTPRCSVGEALTPAGRRSRPAHLLVDNERPRGGTHLTGYRRAAHARYLVGSGLSSVPCPCSAGSRTAAAELHTATGNAVRAVCPVGVGDMWPVAWCGGVVRPPLANGRDGSGRRPASGSRRSRSSCSRGRRDVLRVCLVRRAQPFLDSIRYSTPRRGRRAGALLSPSCYLPARIRNLSCLIRATPPIPSFLPSFPFLSSFFYGGESKRKHSAWLVGSFMAIISFIIKGTAMIRSGVWFFVCYDQISYYPLHMCIVLSHVFPTIGLSVHGLVSSDGQMEQSSFTASWT